MRTLTVDPADLSPLDRPKALPALERYRLERVERAPSPAFDAAYEMLASFFLARGELEERSALIRFIEDGVLPFGPGLEGHYHMVVAYDGDELVGVRDCYAELDLEQGVCLVALSHSFVAPEHRRGGLAALLRAVPLGLARQTVRERFGRPVPTLVIAEMESVHPDEPETVVRLLAYGRSGFRVMDPRRMPYSQPEFRDLAGVPWTGIPLLGVVRSDFEDALPVELAAAFPRLFHSCHRLYLPRTKVDPSEAHALQALRTSPEPLPLLPLPRSLAELDLLAPLLRGRVMPLYPRGLQGPDPRFSDPDEELQRLRERWLPRTAPDSPC